VLYLKANLTSLGQGKSQERSLTVGTSAALALALGEHLESLHSSSGTQTLAVLLGVVVVVGVLVLLDGIWWSYVISMCLDPSDRNLKKITYLPHQGPHQQACSASVREILECFQRDPCHQKIRLSDGLPPWRCQSRRFHQGSWKSHRHPETLCIVRFARSSGSLC